MTLLSLTLVIFAGFVHAGWNFLAKSSGGDVRFVLLMTVAVAIIWAPLGVPYIWHEVPQYGLWQWTVLLLSAAVHIVYHVVLLRGYRKGELSVVYPLARGTAPLFTASAACLVLNENLGVLGWIGVASIVTGVVWTAGGPALVKKLLSSRTEDLPPEEVTRLKAGLGYGLLCGLIIASYSVLDGYAVKEANMTPVGMEYVSTLVRIPMTIALLMWLRRSEPLSMGGYFRRLRRPILIVGALSPVSYVLMLYASTLAPLSHVAPAREVSMLFAALFAGTLLGEKSSKARIAGAGCIAGGVTALAFA